MELLDPAMFGDQNMCFACSPHNPASLGLRFFRDGDRVVVRHTPTELQQGPRGIMHGGLQATLVDELGAYTLVGLLGRFGFTTSMNLRFASSLKVGEEVEGVGTIASQNSRLITTNVELLQGGKSCLKGTVVFALFDGKTAERLMGTLPPEWERFCRP